MQVAAGGAGLGDAPHPHLGLGVDRPGNGAQCTGCAVHCSTAAAAGVGDDYAAALARTWNDKMKTNE